MLKVIGASALLVSIATTGVAQDIASGEKIMRKCKACHTVSNGDEVLFKGGKTGPNLFGVVGQAAAGVDGYKYSKSMIAAREAGLVWDEDNLAAYLQDPSKFLKEYLDDSGAKSKMSLKLRKGMEDVIAYLGSFAES